MEILAFSFNSVAPMFIPIALGVLLAARGMIGDREISFLNTLCFKVLLPVYLFNNVFATHFMRELDIGMVLFFIVAVTALIIAAWVIFALTVEDIERRAIYITVAYRSNNLIFALPLAGYMFGEVGLKSAAMLVPITIIFFNLYTVIVLVYHANLKRRRAGGNAANTTILYALKRCAIDVLKNPLIIGSLLGISCSILNLRLPQFIEKGVNSIGNAATAVSLVLLGGQINVREIGNDIKNVIWPCLIRLIIVPAFVVPAAVMCGFRGPDLGVLVVAFSAPPAIANMIMARNYNLAPRMAAQTVYIATSLSILTVFIIISILRAMKLF
jgi:predicted permease